MTPGPFVPKRAVFSTSAVMDAVASALSAIKAADGLTMLDMAAVLGVSDKQAGRYLDGTAAMSVVTFARAKREWNGRFTGGLDRLCADSRPVADPRDCEASILKAALVLSEGLADGDLSLTDVARGRSTLERARDAIDAQLGRLGPKGDVA